MSLEFCEHLIWIKEENKNIVSNHFILLNLGIELELCRVRQTSEETRLMALNSLLFSFSIYF